jgi:hypothetical protein
VKSRVPDAAALRAFQPDSYTFFGDRMVPKAGQKHAAQLRRKAIRSSLRRAADPSMHKRTSRSRWGSGRRTETEIETRADGRDSGRPLRCWSDWWAR